MGILDALLAHLIVGGIKKATGEVSREKQVANLEKAAEEAGMTPYAYIKSQMSDSVRSIMEEKKDDPEKLHAYLSACVDQKLLSQLYVDMIWEEEKGQCALRRLQATGGAPWNPHDILRGLAPEKILNQCDKDAGSYGLQIVYLDQQVVQENVTRETADLILNIYKLAREE